MRIRSSVGNEAGRVLDIYVIDYVFHLESFSFKQGNAEL